jgi:ABC-2 type transport system permease protein
MLSRSFIEQVKCRWREFRREPSAFFWVIMMPIIWIVVLGIAFSNPKPERYGIGWLNTPAGDSTWDGKILADMEKSKQIKLKQGDAADMELWFKRGEIAVYVEARNQKLIYHYDPNNPEASRAKYFVDDLIQRANGRQDVVISEDVGQKNVGGRYVDFLIPGILGLSIMSSSLFGTGMTLVSNRKENLLKRYIATPMPKSEFLFSHIVGRLVILVAEFLSVIFTGYFIFKFTVFGSYTSFVLFSILGAGAFTAIALLCAARTRNLAMAGGLINLVTIPSMMLSGVFFSKNNFPDWLLPFINALPLTALNDGLRKIALEGQPLWDLGFESLVLGVYLVGALVISRFLFKWY